MRDSQGYISGAGADPKKSILVLESLITGKKTEIKIQIIIVTRQIMIWFPENHII